MKTNIVGDRSAGQNSRTGPILGGDTLSRFL